MTIASKIEWLRETIKDISEKSEQRAEEIKLVLVTKTVSTHKILEAYNSGVRDFGENRVQELLQKKDELPKDIKWHLIGHLQTNKVKNIFDGVVLIQSLDNLKLVNTIEKEAEKKEINEVPCLLQINTSAEDTKFGLDPKNVSQFISSIKLSSPVKIHGIMTIGPFTGDESKIRNCFRDTKVLFDTLKVKHPEHKWNVLSMGMSADYKIAIEEGANLLRIGSLVFGER